MTKQIHRRGGQLKDLLIMRSLSQEKVEKLRALEPPVSKELCVEGTEHDWLDGKHSVQLLDLLNPALKKMTGVGVCRSHGPVAPVVLLILAAGDAIILDAGEAAMTDVGIDRR